MSITIETNALDRTRAAMARKTSLATWSREELENLARDEAQALIERCTHAGRLNGVELMSAFGLAGITIVEALEKHGLAAPNFLVDMIAQGMKGHFETRRPKVGRPRKEPEARAGEEDEPNG
jgi:hypothetical protein